VGAYCWYCAGWMPNYDKIRHMGSTPICLLCMTGQDDEKFVMRHAPKHHATVQELGRYRRLRAESNTGWIGDDVSTGC